MELMVPTKVYFLGTKSQAFTIDKYSRSQNHQYTDDNFKQT